MLNILEDLETHCGRQYHTSCLFLAVGKKTLYRVCRSLPKYDFAGVYIHHVYTLLLQGGCLYTEVKNESLCRFTNETFPQPVVLFSYLKCVMIYLLQTFFSFFRYFFVGREWSSLRYFETFYFSLTTTSSPVLFD